MTIQRLVGTSSRAAARAVLDGVSDAALAELGLRREGRVARTAPLLASFLVGASAAVGLMLWVAPGSADTRRLLASRIRHARNVLLDAEIDVEDRLAAARAKALALVTGQKGASPAEGAGQVPAQG